MWKVEVEFEDFEREWIEYIARVKGISVKNVVRNFVREGLRNKPEQTILEFYGYDDGIGRTRVEDGRFADPAGDMESARISEELREVLKPCKYTFIRTLSKGAYSIKMIEIITCNAFTVKYCVAGKNANGKVIELKGDKAAERIVDEFGMPYVKQHALALLEDVRKGNVLKYINCVYRDKGRFINCPRSSIFAAAYLHDILVNKKFNNQADINMLFYAYNVCKDSASYALCLHDRERRNGKFVTNVSDAEKAINMIVARKKVGTGNVSNKQPNKKFDLADYIIEKSGEAVRKRLNKNKKKD